jgi:hypothetical protein
MSKQSPRDLFHAQLLMKQLLPAIWHSGLLLTTINEDRSVPGRHCARDLMKTLKIGPLLRRITFVSFSFLN